MSARRRHQLRWIGSLPEACINLWWAPRTYATPPREKVRFASRQRRLWIERPSTGFEGLNADEARAFARGHLARGIGAVVGLRALRVLRRLAKGGPSR